MPLDNLTIGASSPSLSVRVDGGFTKQLSAR